MQSSLRIARAAGIDIRVHSTFFLLLGWVLISDYATSRSATMAFSGMLFLLILFTIVVLHELGHALAAAHYGIRTRQIMLLPIGGIASLERIPEDPRQELVVAIAGPLVNVLLATICLLVSVVLGTTAKVFDVTLASGGLLPRLFWVNVGLAVFNMVPAFPMDGGRVLRALLATFIGRPKATAIAAGIGQSVAIIFGILGLLFQPILLFTALFIWIGAKTEAAQVQMEAAVEGLRVRDVMSGTFEVIDPNWSLDYAMHFAAERFQSEFPVVAGGQVVGFMTLPMLSRSLSDGGNRPVAEFMDKTIVTTSPNEALSTMMQRWQEAGGDLAVVLDRGQLVGILTPQQLAKHLLTTHPHGIPGPAVPHS